MKLLILLALPLAAAVHGQALRIATWNIHHGTHLDTLLAEMSRRPADLFLLQEVDRNTTRAGNRDIARQLGDRLHMQSCFAVEFEELSQEHGEGAFTGQATLSRLPILHTRILRFKRQSGFWQPRAWIPSSIPLMQRRRGARVALVTELEFAGHPLIVYNAHLESRSAGFIQDKQLDEILADSRHYPASAAIVIAGDLNTKYLPHIFLHKLEAAGFHSVLGERIERTHRIAFALDWIFVKGSLRIVDGAVIRDLKGSDHYPIYATLQHGQ